VRLHSRLVALNAVAIGILTLLLTYFVGSSVKAGFETEIEEQLYRSAILGKSMMRLHPQRQDPEAIARDIAQSLDARVTIIAPDGRVLGDSDVAPDAISVLANHSDRPEVIQALHEGRGSDVRSSATLGTPFIYVAVKLDEGGVLRVAKPLSAVEALTSGVRKQLLLAMVAGLAVTCVFGYMVFALVSRPLRQLAEASHNLAAGNLERELPVAGDRDLAVVASSLNAMASSLRLRMEDLELDKRRIEAIVGAMSAGVVVFDRDARVEFTNEFIRKLLDVHGEFAGKIPMELVRNPSLEIAVRNALRAGEVSSVEFTTSTGKVLSARAAPVRMLSGQVERVVVVFHDLTEIRRTERMRKDFVANVSHEFKTPLSSIRGYAETLLNSPPADAETAQEFLDAIERNASLLQALVDDLLVLAQMETEVPVERRPLKISELVEEQVASRRHLLQDRGLHLEIACPSTEILADRLRLSRAFSNLLDNAIHYNRPGGRIRITGRPAGGGFILDVNDSGIGMRDEDLRRIFERFYRVEKSRTRDAGGTGLGLAIAKHAIESQGGTISVTSKLGAGSTFTIFLPNQ